MNALDAKYPYRVFYGPMEICCKNVSEVFAEICRLGERNCTVVDIREKRINES